MGSKQRNHQVLNTLKNGTSFALAIAPFLHKYIYILNNSQLQCIQPVVIASVNVTDPIFPRAGPLVRTKAQCGKD